MNYALLFKIANLSVLSGWLLLLLAPKSKLAKVVVHSYLYPFLLGALYLYLMVTSFGGEGGMDTLENLKLSFSRDEILVLGWVHYLVFDLFIGAWMTRDAAKNGILHIAIVPSLVLTLFAGPIGLLSYMIIRAITLRKLML